MGWTPLHRASESGSVAVARVLLEYGVVANVRDARNRTPLHLVPHLYKSPGGRLDVLRLLLRYGSDIHARDNEGRTPFMRATENEDHAVMQLLVECGAEDHIDHRSRGLEGLS